MGLQPFYITVDGFLDVYRYTNGLRYRPTVDQGPDIDKFIRILQLPK